MDVMTFANAYLRPYKIKGNEIVPSLCPFCHGGDHRDKDTAAMNIENGAFNCKRGSCGKQLSFWQLCKEFGEEPDRPEFNSPRRSYRRPQTKITPLVDAAEKYLALRKISRSTMDAYGVGCDGKGNIVFPFKQDGEVVFVKFRPARKVKKGERKAWREENTKPVLFGMDLCDPSFPLCIFEGEIDAMSGHEAGIPNAVSVPSGADDLTWIDTCWEWLQQFTSIIFYGDNDQAGREMVQKLSVRLSDYRLYIVDHPCKDANELLYRDGPEAVKSAYKAAREVPVYGLINLADVVPLDVKHVERAMSGIPELDKLTGGFLMGELSVWTGKRGEGKSTLLGQLMLETVDQKKSVCVYSGEMQDSRFQYWINLQAAGRDNIQTYRDPVTDKDVRYVEHETANQIKAWYAGKFWLYDNRIAKSTEIESILNVFDHAVKRYDCRVFMVDNLMTVHCGSGNDRDYYRMQSNLVEQLVSFAKKYNVHVHLVAHPRKTSGEVEADDVSGSGDITNRADNVFSLKRLTDEQRQAQGYDVLLTIRKNRDEGATGKIGLNYDPVSRRLYMPSKGNTRIYGWENPGEDCGDFFEISEEG